MRRAPAQPSRTPREIWVLIAAAFIIALGYGIIAPVLPQYAQQFDVGVAAASMIVSAFAAMRLLFTPAGGWLVTRFRERIVYVVGLFIVAASTAACAFAQSYVQLLVFRGLGGIGSTMFTIAAMGLIVRLAPPQLRGRTSALYGTSFLVGNVVGPVLGSALSFLGFRAPFLIYAVALVIAAIVAATFLSTAQLRPASEGEERPAVLSLREALANPAYRAVLVANFAHGWTNFGVRVALIPLFAAAVPTIGAPMAGLGLTAFALGNFLTLQGSGRLVDSRGRRPVVLIGLLVCGLANIAFGWVTGIPLFLTLSALGGAGAALVAPAQQAALADIVGRDRSGGQAIAAFSMASDLGAILGPMAAGLLAGRFGFGFAFGSTGVLLLLAGVPWLLTRDTVVRDEQPVT
ncbi:MFS transporter [Nigerium massiliense]|uniref:MFS transporter n=1 Tax=Nigerium massiliense TaxID=1522317 RepID=UPI00058B4CC2|nr:MFS transporter [Nigerium massiliense]